MCHLRAPQINAKEFKKSLEIIIFLTKTDNYDEEAGSSSALAGTVLRLKLGMTRLRSI